MFVILETAREKVTHKADNLVIETFDMSLLNGSIILVYDDNGGYTVILVEHTGKICQCTGEVNSGAISRYKIFYTLLIGSSKLLIIDQLGVAGSFLGEQFLDGTERFFPRVEFYILEAQEDYGVLTLIFTILFTASPNFLVLEIDRSILVSFLEERAEHIHI